MTLFSGFDVVPEYSGQGQPSIAETMPTVGFFTNTTHPDKWHIMKSSILPGKNPMNEETFNFSRREFRRQDPAPMRTLSIAGAWS